MGNVLLARDSVINYKHLGLALSWRCDAHCTHCFIPRYNRSRGSAKSELTDVLLEQLPASIRIIGFTGGEPFINPLRFIKEIEKVGKSGRTCSVVTNGLWIRKHRTVDSILRKAYEAGLRWLSISYDNYHRPRLDAAELTDLIRVAQETGLTVNLRGIGMRSSRLISKIKKTGVLTDQKNAISCYSLDNIGEAQKLKNDDVNNYKGIKCLSVLHPLVDPVGRVFACCSTRTFEIKNNVLMLGNIYHTRISELLKKSSSDYILLALLALGPKELYKIIDPKVYIDRSRYNCEVCLSLLNNINMINKIRKKIESDHELQKTLIGSYMIYESCYRPGIHPLFDI